MARVGVPLAAFGSLCILVKFGFVCVADTLKGLGSSYISHPPLKLEEKNDQTAKKETTRARVNHPNSPSLCERHATDAFFLSSFIQTGKLPQ